MPTQEQKVALSQLKAVASTTRYVSVTTNAGKAPDNVSELIKAFNGDQLRDKLKVLSNEISDDALNAE